MSYISLSDLYEAAVATTPVAPPLAPRQQVASTHVAPIIPGFNPSAATQVLSWDSIGKRLFNLIPLNKKGQPSVGRGEFSVAYLLTGLPDENSINAFRNADGSPIIGRTNKSVDVTTPFGGYEVKEIPFGETVKTGALNDPVLTGIRKAVENTLEPLEAAYDALDTQGQFFVDNHLKGVFTEWYTANNAPKARKPKPATVESWNEHLKEFHNKYKNWTLKKYIRSILDRLRELPTNLLLKDTISLGRYGKRTGEEGDPTIIFSIPQLERFLFTEYGVMPPAHPPAVKDLTDILYKYYGETEADKEFLKQQAQRIDIQLGQERAQQLGKKTTIDSFRRAVAQMNLPRRVALIADAFGASGLQKIFPHTGVFLVTEENYQYIPRAELGKYLQISSVSGGEVKVQRKANAAV